MSVNFMSAVIVHSDFGAQENIICHCFHFFPFYLPWSDGAKIHIICMKESESEVAQACPTLCDPMDYSLPGSPVHGIFQATILEWVAISFSILYDYLKSCFANFSGAQSASFSTVNPFRACWKSTARAAQPAVAVVSSPFPILKKCTSIINNHVPVS